MAWRRSGDKPLSEPMMVSLLTRICITWPQWVKLFAKHCISNFNRVSIFLHQITWITNTWWLEIFIQFTIQDVEHIFIVSNLEATSHFGNCLYQSVIMWFLSCDSHTMRKPFWHLHDTFWCSCFSILTFTKTCAGNKILQIKPIN